MLQELSKALMVTALALACCGQLVFRKCFGRELALVATLG